MNNLEKEIKELRNKVEGPSKEDEESSGDDEEDSSSSYDSEDEFIE